MEKLFDVNKLFVLQTIKNKLTKEKLSDNDIFPVYSSDTRNNGIVGYSNNPEFICDESTPVYVVFGDHTRSFNIALESFSVLDNVKVTS